MTLTLLKQNGKSFYFPSSSKPLPTTHYWLSSAPHLSSLSFITLTFLFSNRVLATFVINNSIFLLVLFVLLLGMASVFIYHVVGDLTVGKPELAEFYETETVEAAIKAIGESTECGIPVWKKKTHVGIIENGEMRQQRFVGILNSFDIVAFLAKSDCLEDQDKAMKTPVSQVIVPNNSLLKQVDPGTRLALLSSLNFSCFNIWDLDLIFFFPVEDAMLSWFHACLWLIYASKLKIDCCYGLFLKMMMYCYD